MDYYKIMVEGEDRVTFCYKDNVSKKNLERVIEACIEDYPCGHIWADLKVNLNG